MPKKPDPPKTPKPVEGGWQPTGKAERRTFGAQTRWLYEVVCACGTLGHVPCHPDGTLYTKRCRPCNSRDYGGRNRRHGHTALKGGVSPTYRSWRAMKARCENPLSPGYERYGGVGVKVCERWQTFDNFVADMGERPDGTTLDRIDHDKDYEPGNARWASKTVQSWNRKCIEHISFNGRVMPLAAHAKAMGIKFATVWSRIEELGWTVERALSTPARRQRHVAAEDA